VKDISCKYSVLGWKKFRVDLFRFYCNFQQSENPRWLTSSRVNDGICDCCDGSDEWLHIKLPDHVAVHGLLLSDDACLCILFLVMITRKVQCLIASPGSHVRCKSGNVLGKVQHGDIITIEQQNNGHFTALCPGLPG